MNNEIVDMQYWLLKLDQHGNPELCDGPHCDRNGADKALYLIGRMGLSRGNERYAIGKLEITEPDRAEHKVNDDAVERVRMMVEWARIRPLPQPPDSP